MPEPIFSLGSFVVTNSMFTSFLVALILIVSTVLAARKFSLIPKGFSGFIEFVLESLFDLGCGAVGEKKARKFFPITATIFLFVITSNYIGLLPGNSTLFVREIPQSEDKVAVAPQVVYASSASTSEGHELNPMPSAKDNAEKSLESESIKPVSDKVSEPKTSVEKEKFIPIFRSPSADLNLTLVIALFAVCSIQLWGIRFLGLGYFKKFINFSNPINFLVGILEIVSEISKLISFSFRLFGNVFAGEVLLIVIASLTTFIFSVGTLPFIFLELFVGFIQAFVFSMLTLVFLGMATESHDH